MSRAKTVLILCLCLSTLSNAWFFSSDEPVEEKQPKVAEEQLQNTEPVVVVEQSKEAEVGKLVESENEKINTDSPSSSKSGEDLPVSPLPPSPPDSRIIDDDAHNVGGHHTPHGGVVIPAEHDAEFDHRAILGSVEKAEEFHHLSPTESKRRLWLLTKKIDADDNGEVTEGELQKWISQSLKSLNEEESLRRFKEHDQDEDGNLGWEEYLKSFYGYIPDAETLTSNFPEDSAHFIKVFREDESKFSDADVDENGWLTEKEFRAFTHPEDFAHMHFNYIQRLVNETDLNGDGAIDLEEFLKHGDDGGYSESEAEEWRAIEADRFTRGLDQDSNAKLEGPEIVVWAVPNITDVARDEATHLIYAADKNRDAVLSVEEILGESDLFVGSAVTDYGQHLNDEL